VLDLSRIEAGGMEIESAPFALDELLTNVAEVVRPSAAVKGLEVNARISPDLPRLVLGDGRRLRQVLVNLLANAIKFTEKGHIDLVAEPTEAGDIWFQVKDTGPGIPKDKLATVFEQFAQGDPSLARKHGGFGLGLAIASKLVTMMGGTILIESELGKGTTFHVNMRFATQERTTSGMMPKASVDVNALVKALSSRKSTIRILLVDDSDDNHELVSAYLAGLPIAVRCVSSGPDALIEVAGDAFDLILLDMHMPGMDGCATLRAIREFERTSYAERTPVLIMSADVLTESIQAAHEAGSDGYLSKPVRRVTLLGAILRYCDDTQPTSTRMEEEAPKMDPTLAPILPRFLENRRLDCDRMREATGAHDFTRVAILAHNLKGTGGAFGFPDLSELGGKLETLAKAGESDQILSALDVLAERLDTSTRNLAEQLKQSNGVASSDGRKHG